MRRGAGGEVGHYTSKIIKGGALMPDTVSILAAWDMAMSPEQNLDRLLRQNVLSKSSRMRSADVLTVFRRRYVTSPDMLVGLVTLVRGFPAPYLSPLMYVQTALTDRLVFDFVVDFVGPRSLGWRREIFTAEVRAWLLDQVAAGKTEAAWSPATADRIAQGLLSTLRDFGALEGKAAKRTAILHLPLPAFAFLAFVVWSRTGSSRRFFADRVWRLFPLDRGSVERLLAEAHQEGLLQYQAAGRVVRLDFPAHRVEEYAHVLVEGSHRYIGGRPTSVPA